MSDEMARVEFLTVVGDADAWRSIGLTVSADGMIPLIGTALRVVAPTPGGPTGLLRWALSGIDAGIDSIDGVATDIVATRPPQYADHELGATDLDHVVVMTSDLERTTAAIADATGCELKRVRDVGPIRQGFHRIGRGGLIVEVVHHQDDHRAHAELWGLVVNVDDIDAAFELLGPERLSPPKDAVQPGRRIATVRGDVGLGTAVALMSRPA